MSGQSQLEKVEGHVDAVSPQGQLLSQSLDLLSRVPESDFSRLAAEGGRELAEAVPAAADAAESSAALRVGTDEGADRRAAAVSIFLELKTIVK